MAFDFPNAPVDGQLYPTPAVPGQPQYQWHAAGTKWMMLASVGSTGIPEAPSGGLVYGRQPNTWTAVLPLAGGTMTGAVALVGSSTAVTQTHGDNSTNIATTAFVLANSASKDYISVKDYGADPTGVADSTGAFQTAFGAISNGGMIFVPVGRYLINSRVGGTIADRKSFNLVGAGMDATVIYFPTNQGMYISCLGWASSVNVSNLTLSAGAAGGGNPGFIVQNETYGQCSTLPAREPITSFTNVSFRGDDEPYGSLYWSYGLQIYIKSNVSVTNCYFCGSYTGPLGLGTGTGHGNGIWFGGSTTGPPCGSPATGGVGGIPVVLYVTDCVFSCFDQGIIYANSAQGIFVTSSNFVEGNVGIYCGPNTPGIDQLTVTSCQFGYLPASLSILSDMSSTAVSNSLFIIPANGNGIQGVFSASQFVGNTFAGISVGGNTGLYFTDGTTYVNVTGNTFDGLSAGIGMAPTVSHVNIQSNQYPNTPSPVLGGDSTVKIGGGSA